MCNEERNGIRALLKGESGRAALEYAVVLALVVMGCLSVVELVGARLSSPFHRVSDVLGKPTAAIQRERTPEATRETGCCRP